MCNVDEQTACNSGLIQAGNMTGFAESIISVNDPNISLEDWCKCGAELIELSVSEAIRENRKHQDQWQEQLIEMLKWHYWI